MSRSAYVLLGLTAIVGALAGILAFAVARLFAAARSATSAASVGGKETAFMAAAMEQAVGELRDQQQAMRARAEASERLSSEIIASMTSGVLVVDQARSVRILNPAGRALLEADTDSAGLPHRTVLARHGALADVIDECLASGRPIVRRAIVVQTTRETASHLGVTVSPVRDEHGAGHGAICLFTDLSDVVELEEQLRLKDSLARLGELTAGIAHEFRNGLATIHGYGRLIDLNRLPEDHRPYIEGIRAETESLGKVVTNFLNFARPAELVLTPVDVGAIVRRAAEDIRGEVQSRQGTLQIEGPFGPVDGDEVLLRQAFSNLLRNALEACVEAKRPPRILVEGLPEPDHRTLRVAVSDNGSGIDDAAARRMFTPFFTTKAKGTGLGLALVQKIVVTHNGRVTAGNLEGGGARFQVWLPMKPPIAGL